MCSRKNSNRERVNGAYISWNRWRVADSCSNLNDSTPPQKIDRAVLENELPACPLAIPSTSPTRADEAAQVKRSLAHTKNPFRCVVGAATAAGDGRRQLKRACSRAGIFYSLEAPRMRSARLAQRSRQKVRKRVCASPARTRKARCQTIFLPRRLPLAHVPRRRRRRRRPS